jgi:hypothetical protein
MTYEEWLASVPVELTDDPLWRMEVYIRLLLTIIPAERGYKMASRVEETWAHYNAVLKELLDDPPMP